MQYSSSKRIIPLLLPFYQEQNEKKGNNMQKHEVINTLLKKYSKRTPIHKRGLEILYDRAESRGYKAPEIKKGLQIMICKNYLRKEYVYPNNDPLQEVIHERIYMEDWEFRDIFKHIYL